MKKIAEKVLVYLVLVVMLFEAAPVAAFAEELQSDAATIALDYSEPQKLDIILPEQYLLNEYNVYTHYETFHHIEDLMCCRQIISEHCPEYLPAFDEVMEWKKIFHANMMVTRKDRFDAYCAWLFDILFEAERRIDISEYDDYQKRIFGFLSERLLNVWVKHHELKVQTRPVYDPAEFLI